jgi:hypothetical protein
VCEVVCVWQSKRKVRLEERARAREREREREPGEGFEGFDRDAILAMLRVWVGMRVGCLTDIVWSSLIVAVALFAVEVELSPPFRFRSPAASPPEFGSPDILTIELSDFVRRGLSLARDPPSEPRRPGREIAPLLWTESSSRPPLCDKPCVFRHRRLGERWSEVPWQGLKVEEDW